MQEFQTLNVTYTPKTAFIVCDPFCKPVPDVERGILQTTLLNFHSNHSSISRPIVTPLSSAVRTKRSCNSEGSSIVLDGSSQVMPHTLQRQRFRSPL